VLSPRAEEPEAKKSGCADSELGETEKDTSDACLCAFRRNDRGRKGKTQENVKLGKPVAVCMSEFRRKAPRDVVIQKTGISGKKATSQNKKREGKGKERRGNLVRLTVRNLLMINRRGKAVAALR